MGVFAVTFSANDPSAIDLLNAKIEALRDQLGEAVAMEAEALAGHDQAKVEAEVAEVHKDQAYLERNHLVAALARIYPSGIKRTNIPGWSSDWHGCVYIDLPAGQISYHYHDSHAWLFEGLPVYESGWDGHDKVDVHRRLDACAKDAP